MKRCYLGSKYMMIERKSKLRCLFKVMMRKQETELMYHEFRRINTSIYC